MLAPPNTIAPLGASVYVLRWLQCTINVQKKIIEASNNFTRLGERRAVPPRKFKTIFFVRCKAAEVFLVLREQQMVFDGANDSTVPRIGKPRREGKANEGRLKPSFADNAGIPLAGARRLESCPRRASARRDPRRAGV